MDIAIFFQSIPYTAPMILSAAITAVLAIHAWRERGLEMLPFIMLLLAIVVWSLGYTIELGGLDLKVKNIGAKIKYIGVAGLPMSWLLFAIKYIGWGEKFITPRNLIFLSIEPLVTYILVLTNDLHGLIWSSVGLDTAGPIPLRMTTHGMWFWIHTAYSYLLMFMGTLLFVRTFSRSQGIYRKQARMVMIGAIFPWLGNLSHITGLTPIPHLDPTPFAFMITALSMAWGLFDVRLLDILPVARDSIVENMQEGVIVLDTKNRIVDLNPSANRLVAAKDSDLIGLPAESVISRWLPENKGFMINKEAFAEIVQTKSDEKQFYEANLSPLYDRKNRYSGKILVLRNITESKQAREELEEAKKNAEIASRSKSEFLANMSHELRTPLNHIMGFTELVLEEHFGDLNETQHEYLQDVLQSSKHLLSLINDILDLSKIEAGKFALDASNVFVMALLESSLVVLKEKAIKHGLRMTTDFGELPETIFADERKLKQILYNLLSNAVKFTPDGGAVVLGARHHTSCHGRFRSKDGREFALPEKSDRKIKKTGGLVEIYVSDTGIGLKYEDLDRIFNPFDQVQAAENKGHQGTGLGLSLTRRLVELHGGAVWAESDGEGKGSTFRFIIPV
ncbi:MAG: histidine kinase N-terminal 7TM domain-containing protein [Desulfobacterales bacterium]|jgi:PAS domain S-box-containing protein